LIDRTRGRRHGFRALDTAREEIIRQSITSFYLKPTRPPFSRLVPSRRWWKFEGGVISSL